MKYFCALTLAFALGVPLAAQVFPGRGYPMPGGRGGVGLPPAVPGGGKGPKIGKQKPAEEPLATFAGTLKKADSKTLLVEGEDSNTTEFVCRKTKYYDGSKKIKASALKPGEHVSVEARHGLDGALEAVTVHRDHPKKS